MKILLKKTRKLSPKKFSEKGLATLVLTEKENGIVIEDGKKILQIPLGKKKIEGRGVQLFLRKIIASAKGNKLSELHVSFDDLFEKVTGIKEEEFAELLSVSFLMADFSFIKYKSKKEENPLKTIFLHTKNPNAISRFIKKGEIIGVEVNKCRELCNTPGGEMTPSILADEARKVSRGTEVRVDILDEFDMESLGMGAILGVAKGSAEKPRFIILRYDGGNPKEKPIVFIGKGVTFDTGGLNLKPSSGILDMHLDMSGAGSVIHTVILAAKLKIKKNIIGLAPAVENMLSGSSYRPGDVLKSLSGKTIEILNTDAEGRVILADALTYAKRFKPEVVVDVATLTGAAMSALGQRASALFSNDAKLANDLVWAGTKAGDYAWELPLWEEYEREVKGNFGDVANIGKVPYGGAIQGAVFLKQFADSFKKWAHIDIAPRMTATDDEYLAKGSVAAGVRLLIKFLEGLDTPISK
jgi:leucyl aminopeptidase